MPSIAFLTGGYLTPINNLAGSGLGFFGAGGFGTSVAVGQYNSSCYITNGNGTAQGPQANQVGYVHPNSGLINGTAVNLQNIPNYQSTLNIHFTNATPVRTQNCQVYFMDRISQNNPPSGVTVAAVPVIHPDPNQSASGSGSLAWEFPSGSSYMYMSRYNNGNGYSPGQSGIGVNGVSTVDMTHDFYLSCVASPNSIGSKVQFGLFASLEYL